MTKSTKNADKLTVQSNNRLGPSFSVICAFKAAICYHMKMIEKGIDMKAIGFDLDDTCTTD